MPTRNTEQRLERIEGHVKNLDTRLARVEQILPTLASKDDLNAFATKEDFEAFAKKDDLKAFATKKDLEAFATKKDLEQYPTKTDMYAFGEREAASMRAFVLEVVEKSSADIRSEMRALFEAQNTCFRHSLRTWNSPEPM